MQELAWADTVQVIRTTIDTVTSRRIAEVVVVVVAESSAEAEEAMAEAEGAMAAALREWGVWEPT
jgi:CTP:molybdopterin cytidylyltransferase MocA